MKTKTPPEYRRQRRKSGHDLAFVELGGRRHYVGEFGSDASNAECNRLLAEWRANGGRPTVPKSDIRVVEVIDRYTAYVEEYYQHAGGTPTCEVQSIKYALRPVRDLFGQTPANDFKAKKLQVVRDRMVASGWFRKQVKKQVGRVRRMFKWAVAQELVDPDVFHSLQTVAGLKRGRTMARETPRIRPVRDEHVDATPTHWVPNMAFAYTVWLGGAT